LQEKRQAQKKAGFIEIFARSEKNTGILGRNKKTMFANN
jgi:hypothetical protein